MALIRPLNGAMNWVMDAILKFCSFGWVSYAHNDFFIWQSQDAKKFKWIAPASAEDIRDIEIKVKIPGIHKPVGLKILSIGPPVQKHHRTIIFCEIFSGSCPKTFFFSGLDNMLKSISIVRAGENEDG